MKNLIKQELIEQEVVILYSQEIEGYFYSVNFTLDSHTKLYNIIGNSPQINGYKLLSIGEIYSNYSIRTNNGYEWKIQIKNYNK